MAPWLKLHRAGFLLLAERIQGRNSSLSGVCVSQPPPSAAAATTIGRTAQQSRCNAAHHLLLPIPVSLPHPTLPLFLLPLASRFILSTAPALSAQTRVAPTLPHVSLPDNAPCTSPSCFIPLSSACARTPVSRQPTVSSLLKLRRTPHTAWHLEPACSAGRRCCAIATCRERPRSSGMCMAPALGSGSGALCFAEAHCALCL